MGTKSLIALVQDEVRQQDMWYIDSGCSYHMTGKQSKMSSLHRLQGGNISFGDKSKGKICGMGTVKLNDHIKVNNVHLVENLGFDLMSVSQLCDQGRNEVIFTSKECIVKDANGEIILKGTRFNNVYIVDPSFVPKEKLCLSSMDEQSELWHQRLGHASFKLIHKLHQKELVRGLPKVNSKGTEICSECTKGKQVRSSFKSKDIVSSSKPLELLHMDLCGPMRVLSLGGNRYIFVIVDDFSRYTWTLFLRAKSEVFERFTELVPLLEKSLNLSVKSIRSDHGTEFENGEFLTFCREKGIDHNFSAPHTPQQNGVVERKNRTLENMARTMLIGSGLSQQFWAEAVNAACYIINRAMLRPITEKTPYELLRGRVPNISHLRIFGCKCFIHNNGKDNLGKFDPRSDEGIFLGYSSSSKAYKVLNERLNKVEESIHVIFNEKSVLKSLQENQSSFEDPFPGEDGDDEVVEVPSSQLVQLPTSVQQEDSIQEGTDQAHQAGTRR